MKIQIPPIFMECKPFSPYTIHTAYTRPGMGILLVLINVNSVDGGERNPLTRLPNAILYFYLPLKVNLEVIKTSKHFIKVDMKRYF